MITVERPALYRWLSNWKSFSVAPKRAELMEERARGAARAETEALRTALLTSLGHDLRTPLTAIRGAAETLRDNGERLPEPTRADLLATVIEEAARMGRFLSNILDMVRVEAGQITPRREPVVWRPAPPPWCSRRRRGGGERGAWARRYERSGGSTSGERSICRWSPGWSVLSMSGRERCP